MKIPYIRICIFLGGLVFVGCSGQSEKTVAVIEKTKSYHTKDCSRVRMANTITMNEKEAKGKNLAPCKMCNPDQRK